MLDGNEFAQRVRRVSASGIITTVPSADFRSATPFDVEWIPGGHLVLTPTQVFRVTDAGAVTPVAGNGFQSGFAGDGGPATSALLNGPSGIAPTPDGGLLIVDSTNERVRKVGSDGVIRTVAGTGAAGYRGDGGPATSAELCAPVGIDLTADGGYLITDAGAQTVRKVDARGMIRTVAGVPFAPGGRCNRGGFDQSPGGFAGDGGPATVALLNGPYRIEALPDGGFVFTDQQNQRVRRVDGRGVIATIGGDGTCCFSGDGGPATRAQLWDPGGLALAPGGGVLFSDATADRVRLIRRPGADSDPGTPVFARSAVLTPLAGRVLVSRSRRVRGPRLVRDGATIDASRGGALLELVAGRVKGVSGSPRRTYATVRVVGGRLSFGQRGRSTTVTALRLRPRLRCAGRRSKRRRLTVTSGRLAVAVVARAARVTTPTGKAAFKVTESCAGTRIAARRGRVRVRDLSRRRTVTVRPGRGYFARAAR